MADAQTAGKSSANASRQLTGLAACEASRAAAFLKRALFAALGSRLVLFLVMAVSARAHLPSVGALRRAVVPRHRGAWLRTARERGVLSFVSARDSSGWASLRRQLRIAGVATSFACYFAAIALVYRLVSLDFSPSIALWTTVFLALFPTSFIFQAVYTESLFPLLTVACFCWSRQGRWALAALTGFAAALTCSSGLLSLVPMIVTLALVTSKRLWIRLALAVVFMAGACWLACLFARHAFVS